MVVKNMGIYLLSTPLHNLPFNTISSKCLSILSLIGKMDDVLESANMSEAICAMSNEAIRKPTHDGPFAQ